jgi:hypothetical protein
MFDDKDDSFSRKVAEEIIHHKKTLWRQPTLHRDVSLQSIDLLSHYKPHRGEIWYELFYDLIFVAAVGMCFQFFYSTIYNIVARSNRQHCRRRHISCPFDEVRCTIRGYAGCT